MVDRLLAPWHASRQASEQVKRLTGLRDQPKRPRGVQQADGKPTAIVGRLRNTCLHGAAVGAASKPGSRACNPGADEGIRLCISRTLTTTPPPSVASALSLPRTAQRVAGGLTPRSVARAPATYPRPYQIRHWPDLADPTGARSLTTKAADSSLLPRLPALFLDGILPQLSWRFVFCPRHSPRQPCDCRIPIAHCTPRSLRAEATVVQPTGRPGHAHIQQSRLPAHGIYCFAPLWPCA